MSETVQGAPPPPPVAVPRLSSVVVPCRRTAQGWEVFWVKRDKALRFAGGFYAFPGGKLDAQDADVPVHGASGQDAALRAAAARELLEEAGVLAAEGAERLTPDAVATLRREVLEGRVSWRAGLERHGLSLRSGDLLEAGRWVTPEFAPVRFDTFFYFLEVGPHARTEWWPGELSEAAWVTPAEALARWEAGTALLHPPALHVLRVLARAGSPERTAAALRTPEHCPDFIAQRIEYQRGVRVFPLRTATLPPATHTNAYVLGEEELLIVDPGSGDEEELARLLALVEGLVAEGVRVKAVVLTHHHGDHTAGVRAVTERLGVPLWCHARTADRVAVPTARLLVDGEVLELAGTPPQRWRVLYTPGHAQGHVCLVDERTRAAVVGDMVAGVGTIVIDPPEGDMAEYLRQLARLRDWPVTTLYAAHGMAIPDGPGKLQEYLDHRAAREARILAALPSEGVTLTELVARAYVETPPFLLPVAERSALAVLLKLQGEGRVREASGRYFPG
ncbi:MBL fold metallo-hydrolase [Archangium primigenium]|uniref:MBL fold metallo-hydrolase n=1 Tax=[Archangium] primigenium TaxID=2792470 RepID=UPI00195C2A31|nr:MBL fold metallo-hydrolase [Archangium primigenium]MBM7113956.1 MBL fold metallo-hydrolase [Archangium primigenium]